MMFAIAGAVLVLIASVFARSRLRSRQLAAAVDEARAAENSRPYVRIDVSPYDRG
jgi:hypothetical protein